MGTVRAKRRVCVPNPDGLHLRAAAVLAQVAKDYRSEIRIRKGERQADAKCVFDLLTLVAECGTELTLEAQGADSQEAINAMADTIVNGFRFLERSYT